MSLLLGACALVTLLNTSVDAKDAKRKYQGRKESMKASCSFPPLLNFERVDVPKTPFGLSLAKPCSHRDFAHQPFDGRAFLRQAQDDRNTSSVPAQGERSGGR